MPKLVHALALLATMGAWGCSACEDTPAVPFKLSTARRGSYEGAGEPEKPAAPAAAALGTGTSFAAGTRQIELGARGLAISEGAIRAALEVDLDADGTAEALLVTEDANGAPVLAHTRQGPSGWAAPEPVAGGSAEGCRLDSASLQLLAGGYAVAGTELDCPLEDVEPGPQGTAPEAAPVGTAPPEPAAQDPPSATGSVLPPPSPPSPEPDEAQAPAATRRERQLWIVASGRSPRLLERIAVSMPADAGALRVEPALQGRDLDADGHGDLVLGLTVRGGGRPDTHVDVELWSRAGGLSVGDREPEATLLAQADRAKTERKRNPARAGEIAEQVLSLHAALCRESGSALLRVGAARGLPCGASLAAGRAASIRVAVLAAQGRLLEALEAYEALSQPAYRLADNDRERARVALDAHGTAGGGEFRAGPALAAVAAPPVRRSAIAFLDEQRLLLRGEPARSYDLATGEVGPIGMPGELRVLDPSGRLAAVAVVRSCQGFHLSIVEASRIALGVVAGPSVSEPLISAAPAPPGARCPQLSPELRRDEGGFQVLAWTAQGILLARGRALWLLAVDGAGRAAAPASELAPGAAIAGLPPHSSELTPDGRYHAIATPFGIAVHDRIQGGARLLRLPPDGAAVTDVAVSPSGQRVAVVRGGRVLVSTPPSAQAAEAAPPR